ncbi:VOC family protein [Rhodosalinus sediminis]|uniref:VOC family protein n=1 Tax=Rhodosalinus sediminis TaxID=1940533 RepID=UPI002356E39F|nr:VOC family protein [Rhodosalinus sediminis]
MLDQTNSGKLPTEGVHHITLVGANRQTSIDFWEGLLGMPFVFEQPNLDDPSESHLYFDPGDGRMITIFTDESRAPDATRTSTGVGAVHHLAFTVSQSVFDQVEARLDARQVAHSGRKDRGFMESIYFEDPLGLTIELTYYRFTVPQGHRIADVMIAAHRVRVAEGARNIRQSHVARAIEGLTAARDSLSKRTD